MTPPVVTPTQGDRELYLALGVFHTCPDEHILAGVHDDIEELQLIARHAAAARAAEIVEQMVREGIVSAAAKCTAIEAARRAFALSQRPTDTARAGEAVPLHWRKPTDHPQDSFGEGKLVAFGLGGRYRIDEDSYGVHVWWPEDEFTFDTFPDMESAKSAAEKHWQVEFAKRLSEAGARTSKAMYERGFIPPHVTDRITTPSPVTDETALSGEAKRYLEAEYIADGMSGLHVIRTPSEKRALRAIRAALASTPQPAVAEETLDEKLRPLLLAFEDFLNEPPRIWDIEPMEVRDYRHEAYRKWEPLCREILAAIRQGQNEARR